MAQTQRRLDRFLDPALLDGLSERSLADLQQLHQEATEIETEVSYVRRLAQARIDIIEAESDRRAQGGSVGDLIAALPQILADPGPRADASHARLTNPIAPSMEIHWNRGLERLISDATLVNLPTLDDDELAATRAQLGELEAEVSETRRSLHRVIDAIDHELGVRVAASQS